MSEMIERVAKAMWEENINHVSKGITGLEAWENESERLRDDWRFFARAAIEAMREPSDKMLSEYVDRCNAGGELNQESDIGIEEDMRQVWYAMIDVALA